MAETVRQDFIWWTVRDHQSLLDIISTVGPLSVLEFGPGASTLTLIEAGINSIETFEDNEAWYDYVKAELLADHPEVNLNLYQRREPLYLPQCRFPRYDLIFVDGPRWVEWREPELIFARDHGRAVACHDWEYETLQQYIPTVFNGWNACVFDSDPGQLGLLLPPERMMQRG